MSTRIIFISIKNKFYLMFVWKKKENITNNELKLGKIKINYNVINKLCNIY